MNHQELSFHDEFPWLWDGLSQQQPLAPYRDPVVFEPYPNVPLHIPLAHTLVPVPALDVPAPKPKPKRAQGSAKAPKEPDELKYTARNLRDIVETAIEVELFTAKHGEKGKKLSEFGAAVRKLGIEGSVADCIASSDAFAADGHALEPIPNDPVLQDRRRQLARFLGVSV
ncbi:hypothetical protein B0H10DRAFT_2236245 [Mycena sp. CBHHK59/15]|nr:hypothetical protein B0H10DRAFT_2236245 [Mycena sp. CBHHK59/15]